MKEIFDSLILGIVQGATEFIPVSSSGHLVIVHDLLGATSGTLLFDILLHVGTLLAVCVYFWADVRDLLISCWRTIRFKALRGEREFVVLVTVATLPAVFFGLFLGDVIESLFRSSFSVALALIAGSVLMWFAERNYKGRGEDGYDLTRKKVLGIGLFQSLALVPGVSRSGATISGGMLLGLPREKAVRLSFLLSAPIIFGATLQGLFNLSGGFGMGLFPLGVGLVSSFGVGLLSIHFLVTYLKYKNLNLFMWYRVVLAMIILIFL